MTHNLHDAQQGATAATRELTGAIIKQGADHAAESSRNTAVQASLHATISRQAIKYEQRLATERVHAQGVLSREHQRAHDDRY